MKKNTVVSFSSTLFLIFCLVTVPDFSIAQTTDTLISKNELKKLSLEELMNIEVTSISMRPEKLTEVASAVQVISREDIHRSGVTRLPEALRLASNLQVSQANSHDWAITSRGFNGLPSAGGVLANKLLVMIDGRSIYSPLFGGVYWDVQNILLEDIDRIEVVSGPGGTLWGANAVNGVINVVTKSAKETQGLFVSGAGGSLLQDHAQVRYGFRLDSTIFCRVYGQRFDQKTTQLSNKSSAFDAWNMSQVGFRMDYYRSKATTLTFQGDFYMGAENSFKKLITTDGQNLLVHYTHAFSDRSDINIKAYADRTWRTSPNATKRSFYELHTYDISFQHRFPIGKRQSLLYGAGYQLRQDQNPSGLNPLNRDMPLANGFLQDEITFVPKLKMTVGSKFLNNVFSGFEFQPSARLACLPNEHHTIWASVSRAVRTPSRFDSDVIITPVKFNSEKVIAYELGYRLRPVDQLLLSFATYYNQYRELRSLDTNSLSASPLIILANSQRAESWGFEFSGNYQATNWWRLRGGYTYFEKNIYAISPKVVPLISEAFEGVDPKNQFILQSIMDLPNDLQLDVVGRYVDMLPAILTIPKVPAYFTFDVRIAWQLTYFEFSLVGQNLLEDYHAETGSSKISRNFYGKITCRF
jgi:iron complex outermembrane receptor protein